MYEELKKLIRLSLPILIAQLSVTSMNLVDTIMAGRYGRDDLAGVAIGGSFWLPAMMFTQAVMFSVTPFVAQACGRSESAITGKYLKQGMLLGTSIGLIVWLLIWLASTELVRHIGAEPHVAEIGAHYLFWVLLGAPIAGAYQAMRSFIEGSGRTKPVMMVNFAGLLANIPLNYIFVYGKLGMPEMGGAGCGVATALVMFLMTVCLWAYIQWGRLSEYAKAATFKPDFAEITHLAKVGLPIAFTLVAEVGIFAVLALLIAPLGTDMVAGHQVALNLSAQTFMLPMSVSLALTVRVGFAVGASDWAMLQRVIRAGYGLGISGAAATAALLFFGASFLSGLYSTDPTVHAIAVALLIYPALYQIPDAIQACSAGILRGFKVTRSPMILVLIAYWVLALPIGYILGRTDWLVPAMGASGLWLGMVLGLSAAAVFLLLLVVVTLRRRKPAFVSQKN